MTRPPAPATLIKDRVLIPTADAWRVETNPTIRSVDRIERVRPGWVLLHVTRAIAPAPKAPRRIPFRLEWQIPAQLRRALLVAGLLLAALAALFTAGALVYALYGDAINHAVRIAAWVAGGFLVLTLIAWVTSLKTGRCPGLHCPGCGHTK